MSIASQHNREQLLMRAMALHQAGDFDKAEKAYRAVLAADPRNAHVLTLSGTLCLQRGDWREGIKRLTLSLAIDPRQPNACNSLGNARKNLRQFDEALADFDRAIALAPDFAEAHYNRGGVLKKMRRFEEALASFDAAIALKPDYAKAYNNRGNALEEWGRYDDALPDYDKAFALSPHNAVVLTNRANALGKLKRYDEALADYARAIELDPAYAEAWFNRGAALQDLKRHDEAMANYDRAIAIRPDYADALYNKGILNIMRGAWEEGWKLYEYRSKTSEARPSREFRQPLWLGKENLAGKTILLHAEQGLGDIILSCRYVPMVEALGAAAVVELPAALSDLISTLSPAARVVVPGDPRPSCDFHCPLMSLPHAFKTTVDTVPARVPYLRAEPQKREQWRRRLGPKAGPRIGVVWAGSGKYSNRTDVRRDVPLAEFARLFDSGHEFVSLQKETRPGVEDVEGRPQRLKRFEHAFGDFSDTAALVMELDLVISVDTSVAHLAGALGKPVWILLPDPPDFLSMLEREDSPWYPTARLFRQPRTGDWGSVIERVKKELKAFSFS